MLKNSYDCTCQYAVRNDDPQNCLINGCVNFYRESNQICLVLPVNLSGAIETVMISYLLHLLVRILRNVHILEGNRKSGCSSFVIRSDNK